VIVDKPTTHANTCYADVGFRQECLVDRCLQKGLRVTLRIRELEGLTDKRKQHKQNQRFGKRLFFSADLPKKLHGTVVSPSEPVNELDTYWGYTVRIAKCISEVRAHGSAAERSHTLMRVPVRSHVTCRL